MRRFVIALLGGCAGLVLLAHNLSAEIAHPTMSPVVPSFFDFELQPNSRQFGIQLGYATAIGASLAALAFVRRRAALFPLAAAPALVAVAFIALFWPPVKTYVGHFHDYPQRPLPFAQVDVDRARRDSLEGAYSRPTLADSDHIEGIQPLVVAEAIRSAGITTAPPVFERDGVFFYESKAAKLDASTRELSFAVLPTEDDARTLFEVYHRSNYCEGNDLFVSTHFRNIVALAGSCTALPTVSVAAAERVLKRVGASSIEWLPH
jgi:hypothetical protein